MNQTYKTRFFNSIEIIDGTEDLRKTSRDHDKLRAEYDYWHSLPDDVAGYFVEPKNFMCDGFVSSYDMKDCGVANAAEQIVTGQMTTESFDLMFANIAKYRETAAKYSMPTKSVSSYGRSLVLGKTSSRVRDLNNSIWTSSSQSVLLKLNGITADDLLVELQDKYEKYSSSRNIDRVLLSHGDLTLSNVLWNEQSKSIALIDPKGLDYMYLDEYYDLAKLSQSLLGKYDYILYGKYTLSLRDATLCIDTVDGDPHKERVFISYLERHGVDYNLLRVYEASLFLSMVPLHLDDLQRVSALLINCKNILSSL